MHPAFHSLASVSLPGGGRACRLRHVSGAEVVAVEEDSPERFFALSFETLPADHSGVAHVLEHLIFRGSHDRPVADLFADLAQAGPLIDLNATTCADLTSFHGSAASEAGLEELIEVMAGALFAPLLDPADFAEERAVVMNEMAGHWAMPAQAALAALRARLFPESHGWDHGGRPCDLARLELHALRGFHRRFYRPERLRLFLSGPIDLPARLAQVDGFPRPPSDPPPPPRAAPGPRSLRHPGLEAGKVMPAFGLRVPHGQSLAAHLVRGLADHAAGHGDLPPPLPGSAVFHDGPDTDLALLFPACHPSEARHLAARLPAELSRPSGLEAGIETLAALVADETPGERHRRLIGAWRHGLDPLGCVDGSSQVAELQARLRSGDLRDFLTALLRDPARSAFLSLEGGAVSEPARRPPAAPSPREAAAGMPYRTPPPVRLPEIPLHGEFPAWTVPGGPARIVLALSLSGVAAEDLPAVALLARHFGRDRALVAEVVPARGAHSPAPGWLMLRGVAVGDRPLADRIADTVTGPLPDGDELRRLIAALMAAMPPPHLQAALRLGASVSAGGAMADRTAGLSLRAALLRHPPDRSRLERVRLALCGRAGMGAVATRESPAGLVGALARPDAQAVAALAPKPPMREVHPIPGPLNTLGLTLRLPPSPLLSLVAHSLETGWLRDEVRRRGGAYGVRCLADPIAGALTLLSARDPHREPTFERFRASGDWLTRELRGAALARFIAGTAIRLARPLAPGPALADALRSRLSGISPDSRGDDLARVLAATERDIAAVADRMSAAFDQAATVEFIGNG